MFCPECGSEYIDGIVECLDCEKYLVSELSAPADDEQLQKQYPSNPVTIFSAFDQAVVVVAKSLLMSANITFFSKNENLSAIGGFGFRFPSAMGPIELLVDDEDASDAQELLRDLLK